MTPVTFFGGPLNGRTVTDIPDYETEWRAHGARYRLLYLRGDGTREFHLADVPQPLRDPSMASALRMLPHFELASHDVAHLPKNFRLRSVSDGSWLVQVHSVEWIVSDNGGEWNVERVNSGELPVSIAESDRNGWPANEATMAMRIAQVMRGQRLDYAEVMTHEDQEALMVASVRDAAAAAIGARR